MTRVSRDLNLLTPHVLNNIAKRLRQIVETARRMVHITGKRGRLLDGVCNSADVGCDVARLSSSFSYSGADLGRCRTLLFDRTRDRDLNLIDLTNDRADFRNRVDCAGDTALDRVHSNRNILSRSRGLLRELLNLSCNDGEALTSFTSSGLISA